MRTLNLGKWHMLASTASRFCLGQVALVLGKLLPQKRSAGQLGNRAKGAQRQNWVCVHTCWNPSIFSWLRFMGVGQHSGVERSAVTRTSGTSQLCKAGVPDLWEDMCGVLKHTFIQCKTASVCFSFWVAFVRQVGV